jgi:cytochrome b pre-mRNA-processing protein 3
MIFALFRRDRHDVTIDRLYGAIVAQARLPVFYTELRVPDTIEGRLEMIILHAVLVLQRMRAGSPGLKALGQAVFDRFCRDMDDNLRELGVGDLAVPRQMRRIGSVFYGRARVYEAALAAADPADLVAALRRNIYGEAAAADAAERLAAYVRAVVFHLRDQDDAVLAAGELNFPDPRSERRQDDEEEPNRAGVERAGRHA